MVSVQTRVWHRAAYFRHIETQYSLERCSLMQHNPVWTTRHNLCWSYFQGTCYFFYRGGFYRYCTYVILRAWGGSGVDLVIQITQRSCGLLFTSGFGCGILRELLAIQLAHRSPRLLAISSSACGCLGGAICGLSLQIVQESPRLRVTSIPSLLSGK